MNMGLRPLSFQVISLELSTGIPMLYIFKEGRFIRRGSPVGPSEASVYAYTKVRVFPMSSTLLSFPA
jgi:2,3-bisphosphoglycerate-dependent phosphoglycerate mutase